MAALNRRLVTQSSYSASGRRRTCSVDCPLIRVRCCYARLSFLMVIMGIPFVFPVWRIENHRGRDGSVGGHMPLLMRGRSIHERAARCKLAGGWRVWYPRKTEPARRPQDITERLVQGHGVGRALAAAAERPPRRTRWAASTRGGASNDLSIRTCPVRPQDVPPPRISAFRVSRVSATKGPCARRSPGHLGVDQASWSGPVAGVAATLPVQTARYSSRPVFYVRRSPHRRGTVNSRLGSWLPHPFLFRPPVTGQFLRLRNLNWVHVAC